MQFIMKIDRIDVCHETIQEETNESLIVSVVETDNEEEFAIRFHLNYHEEISPLVGLCVDEMNNTPEARDFFLKVVDQYWEQF
jgi:hypothetical protein